MVKRTGEIKDWVLGGTPEQFFCEYSDSPLNCTVRTPHIHSGWGRGNEIISRCPKCGQFSGLEKVSEHWCDCGGYPDACPGYEHVECKNCGWSEEYH